MTESEPTYKVKRGRPAMPAAERKRAKGIRIAPDVFEFLATQREQNAFIEAAIRKTAAFREWKSKKDGR